MCAGVRFLQPRSLVSLLIGRDRDDPWDPDRLVWPVLATIDASLGEPWCATLAAHLGHGLTGDDADLRRDRRYSVAFRLASLFASYAVQRPQLVTDWREGRDTDGAGQPLDADLDLAARAVAPAARPGRGRPARRPPCRDARGAPVRRCARASTQTSTGTCRPGCRCSATPACLSPRSSCWPRSASTATSTSTSRRPRPTLWDALHDIGGVVARDDDASAERVGHPLLASLGRDARELRRTLVGAGFPSGDASPWPGDATDDPPTTLLGLLQHDLRANHAPTADERSARRHDPADRSLQVHACHGPARQVEVLREVLVGLLQDDPTLEPRDILVMCPDIETYAPLISAGFGLVSADARPDGRRRRPSRPPAPGQARRPGAGQHQPAARGGRLACSS